MGQEKVTVIKHVCDGCGKVTFTEGDPAEGIMLDWTEVTETGAFGGTIWTCSLLGCMRKALANRVPSGS
jgi:hypothetical protein